jgi:hypothetical protein
LPGFIGNSQKSQFRETTNKSAIKIQISTQKNRPQTRVVIGFALKPGYVDRTLLGTGHTIAAAVFLLIFAFSANPTGLSGYQNNSNFRVFSTNFE